MIQQWFSFWPEKGQQCEWMDGSCSDLKQIIQFAPKEDSSKAAKYKFVLDVDGSSFWSLHRISCRRLDGMCIGLTIRYYSIAILFFFSGLVLSGNGWSARFPFLLASRSLVLKSTIFTEWSELLFGP